MVFFRNVSSRVIKVWGNEVWRGLSRASQWNARVRAVFTNRWSRRQLPVRRAVVVVSITSASRL
jgi:hypothetical protein